MEPAKTNSLLHQKSLFVITGASRGIGKEIAIRMASNVGPTSHFLLMSRNESDLLATAAEMQKSNSSVLTEILIFDISKLAETDSLSNFEKKVETILKNESPFDVSFIVHNAGTTGDLSKPTAKFENGAEVREHLETNLVSFILLNNSFLRMVDQNVSKTRVVVNISSLFAVRCRPGCGLYPVSKSAREGFMRALAAEEPDLRLLNYAPGPVDTDLLNSVKDTSWNKDARQFFIDGFQKGTILTPQQTVTKFLKVLDENKFENGTHVDYYDP